MSIQSSLLTLLALIFLAATPIPLQASNESTATADQQAIWVFFADKPVLTDDEMTQWLHSTFHPQALNRRSARRTAPGLFDQRDWPVNQDYVEAISSRTTRLRTVSRWLNAVSVVASSEQRAQIEALPYVRSIQAVGALRSTTGDKVIDATAVPDDLIPPADFYGASSAQLNQINLVELHDAGFTGTGIIVGILDTGFRLTHDAFNHPDHPLDIIAQYDFVNDDPIAEPEPGDPTNQHEHGTYILGTLGAYLPDILVGGAYDASFVLAKVDDVRSEFFEEEDWFVAGLEFLEMNGADVATSSVVIYNHYTQDQLDGRTSTMTIGYNVATENGMHCFQGAGNEGHDDDPTTSHLLPPADAFQVLTIGAVDLNGDTAWFTSDGPTADGRNKPEILTRGVNTYTVNPNSDTLLATASGTSLARPVAASAGACITQARPDWTVGQLRTALSRTADYYINNQTHDPLFIRGFGITNAFAAANLNVNCLQLDVAPLNAGSNAELVIEGAQPESRVAILWSTQPGSFVQNSGKWCVDFGLKLPGAHIASRTAAIGRTDPAGTFSKNIFIPNAHRGRTVLLQAAQQNTCPDTCMSNICNEFRR